MIGLGTQFITFGLCIACIFPLCYYFVRYSGWKYKSYHQDDLAKTYLWLAATVILLIILIWEMAQT